VRRKYHLSLEIPRSWFADIRRALSPNGRMVIKFLPKHRMKRLGVPKDIFTLREPGEVVNAPRTFALNGQLRQHRGQW
jgi:hypothetical protein